MKNFIYNSIIIGLIFSVIPVFIIFIISLIVDKYRKKEIDPLDTWWEEQIEQAKVYQEVEQNSSKLIQIARTQYPTKLDEYIGHKESVQQLKMLVSNYHNYGRVSKHILLFGIGGLGKTTLSEIMANEIGQGYIGEIGESLQEPKDIDKLLDMLHEGSILFLDEIHNSPTRVLEYLYSVLEYFKMVHGNEVKTYPQFTFIGATTNAEMLPDPFLTRFRYKLRLERYTEKDLMKILPNCLDPEIKQLTNKANELSSRVSQGIIRIAREEILGTCTDVAIHNNKNIIDEDIVYQCLKLKGINPETGLNKIHMKILDALKEGNQIGKKSLSFIVGIGERELEDEYESSLVLNGYIQRTPRGRIITSKGKSLI